MDVELFKNSFGDYFIDILDFLTIVSANIQQYEDRNKDVKGLRTK